MRMGVEMENSLMEIYLTKLIDENGYQSRYDDFSDVRRTQNRPRVVGVRFKYRY